MTNAEMNKAFSEAFPLVVTVDDIMRKALEMADEIERLRAELNVMAEAVLETNAIISRFQTVTSNYLTTRNEGIVEKLKLYTHARIVHPDLWALAIKHRTKHTSTPDYAERRGFGHE